MQFARRNHLTTIVNQLAKSKIFLGLRPIRFVRHWSHSQPHPPPRRRPNHRPQQDQLLLPGATHQ